MDSNNGMFRGRRVAPMRGRSWVQYMTAASSNPQDPEGIHSGSDGYMGWELFGRGAVRQGEWKLVHIESSMGGGKWQLYNLRRDPGEIADLADEEPTKKAELMKLWEDYVEKTGVLWTPHEEIEANGEEWGENREDLVGGNHVGQIKAWMETRQGEESKRGQVIRGG